jgi:hypothetical protein
MNTRNIIPGDRAMWGWVFFPLARRLKIRMAFAKERIGFILD